MEVSIFLNPVTDELKRVDKMVFEERKHAEALHVLETLETNAVLDNGERLQVKILKSYALRNNLGIRLERFEEAVALAEEAFKESQQQKDQVLLVDAFLVKINLSWAKIDDVFEQLDDLLQGIEEAERALRKAVDLSSTDRKRREAYLQMWKASLYSERGEIDRALQYYEKALTGFEELGNKSGIANVLFGLGYLYQFLQRDYAKALPCYQKCLTIAEELGNKDVKAICYHRIGNYHHTYQGDLDQAMDYYQKSLELMEETENYFGWVLLCVIGEIYLLKGQFELALQYQLKALHFVRGAHFIFYNDRLLVSRSVGKVYQALGSFDDALNYYKQGLDALKFVRYSHRLFYSSMLLYNLFSLHFEHGLVKQAENYLQQLEELAGKTERVMEADYKLTNLFYRLAKSQVLKNSSRLIEKAEAQKILQNIVAEEIIFHEYTIEAMYYLCEMFFEELKLSDDVAIMKEVKNLTTKIHEIGQEYHAYPAVVDALILQSKLATLEADIQGATKLLAQAAVLAEEKSLIRHQKKVKQEQLDLDTQLEEWKALYERNAPMYERIEQARLAEYFTRAQKVIKSMK
ncbi:MAG: tetratricopeptide repeat protein [Candidatus Odinarchaeota archaeon]